MSRHQHDTDLDLDPAIAAELDALEAALAGQPSADPDLLALVAAVREDAGDPRPEFRRELDAKAAAGFRNGPHPPPSAWFKAARTWLWDHRIVAGPGIAVAATALIALVVAVGSLNDKDDVTTFAGQSAPMSAPLDDAAAGGSSAAESGSTESAAPPTAKQAAPSASADSAAAVPEDFDEPGAPVQRNLQPGTVAPGTPRKVEQTTQLALRTSAGRLQKVSDGVVRVTQAAGGVVQSSNVDATDRGGTSDFVLSVPSAKADDVVARLSKLAHVASMSQASTDITEAFVSSADQLSDARAERRALLKALEGAKTEEGIARLKARIKVNRNEIASLKGQRDRLRLRADMTTLTVTVTASGAVKDDEGSGGGSWSPGDAAGDALRVLEVAAGVLLIALAVAVPLGLIAFPALFGARVARRRRREQALDPA